MGKIYNILAQKTAARIYNEVGGIDEVSLFLCSQIGKPIDQPLAASAKIIPASGVELYDIREAVTRIIDAELADISSFTESLAKGKFSIC